jgi:hypothetical protein
MLVLKGIWELMNSKLFLLIVSILLTAFSGSIVKWGLSKKADAVRWENNYNISNSESETLRNKAGNLYKRVELLQFTVGDVKRSKDSTVSKMKDRLSEQSIRIRQVNEMLIIRQNYSKELETKLLNKDSLIYLLQQPTDTANELPPLLVGKYFDEFTSAKMYYQNDNWKLIYSARNEISGIVYHQRDKVDFWLFNLRIGEKRYWFNYEEANKNIKTNVDILSIKKGNR